jgi:hypothetical protein
MSSFRIARDPVVYTNLVAAVVVLVSTFVLPLTADQQGVLNALALAVAGLVSGWRVSDGQLALGMALFKSIIAVAVSFGLHWSPEQQLIVIAVVQAIGVAFVRTQVGAPVPPPASTAQLTAVVQPAQVMRESRP